ncbi:MAG TPA: DUF2017 family protein [Chthoniobacterales bacterium]
MTIREGPHHELEFARIEPIEAELLQQISPAAEPGGDERAESRLHPKPAASEETKLLEDWEELVRPELRQLFLSSRETVETDLKALKLDRHGLGFFSIPRTHGDAWLNALNQARLVLAAKFAFTEEELSRYEPPLAFSRRDLVLLQMNFYAMVQERLIEALNRGV